MAKYINVEKVLNTLPDDLQYKASVKRVLIQAPTEDVVEVVRCKDCKYWQDNNNGYPHEECRWYKGETPDADDFCSYGTPKERGGE